MANNSTTTSVLSVANNTTSTVDWLESSLNVTNATFPASPASWHICVLTNYCNRNTAVGGLGVILILSVLPVICRHKDLTLFLKATFCCLMCDDLLGMSCTLTGGLLPVNMPEERYNTIARTLSHLSYLAGNVNCLVMATIAAERVLALRRPELFKRLGKISKVKAALIQLSLWVAGVLLTLPTLLNNPPGLKAYTPLAVVSDFGLSMEASIFVSSSMIVCVVYTYLACTLKRHSASPPDASLVTSSPPPSTSAARPAEINQIKTVNTSTSSKKTTTATTSSQASSSSTSDQHNSRQLQRFRRASIHSAVLGVWFLMAFTPVGFYYIFLLVSDADRKLEQKTTRITILSSFPLLNGLVDPMLLFWRLGRFRSIGEWLQNWVSWFTDEVRLVAHRLRRVPLTCRHRGRCFKWWRRRMRAGRNRVGGSGGGGGEDEEGGGGGVGTGGGGLKTVVVEGPGTSRTIRVREASKGKRLRFVSKNSTPSTSSSAPVAKPHPSPSSSSSSPSPTCQKGKRVYSIPEQVTEL